jgi:phage tail-like protein
MANETLPFIAFNFEIQLIVPNAAGMGLASQLCNGEFAECDGLEMSMEPKKVSEGGNNLQQIHLVGPVSYGNLTLKRGMTSNLDLWNWFRLAAGNNQRGLLAQGVVLMKGADMTPVLRFSLTDCLPIKLKAAALNAKEGSIAIEELQIAYSSFTVQPA